MGLFVLLVVVVIVVVGLVRSRNDDVRETSTRSRPKAAPANVAVRPTTRGDQSSGPQQAASVRDSDADPHRLIGGASFPLTISNASGDVVHQVRRALADRKNNVRNRQGTIQASMLRQNWECVELEAYLSDLRMRVETGIDRLVKASTEWPTLGSADQAELRDDFLDEVWESLPTRPSSYFEDYRDALLAPPATDLTADDALIERYGMEALRAYFGGPPNTAGVVYIPTDYPELRSAAESLTKHGLMRRGADIPVESLVQGLTIAQMRELVHDLSPPKWTRRAQGIAFLLEVPDFAARLGTLVPIRSQFQRLPLPPEFAHLDLDSLRLWWRQAEAKSLLLIWAFSASQDFEVGRSDRAHSSWIPDVYEPCCPLAKRLEERFEPLPRRSLPKSFPTHFGCCVRLEPSE